MATQAHKKWLNILLVFLLAIFGILLLVRVGHDFISFVTQDFPAINWAEKIRQSFGALRDFNLKFLLLALLLSPFAILRFPYGTLIFLVSTVLLIVGLRRRKNKILFYSIMLVSLIALYLCGFIVLTT